MNDRELVNQVFMAIGGLKAMSNGLDSDDFLYGVRYAAEKIEGVLNGQSVHCEGVYHP